MLKNKEVRRMVILDCLLVGTFACLVAAKILSGVLGILLLGGGLIVHHTIVTAIRYREIAKLANYLVQLYHGDRSLDIRDNKEGELSILKNEIYKLSVQLQSQADLLQRDKTYLADALSDISHQLKTPLTSMMMMVDFLQQDSLPEDKKNEFLHNMSLGITRMEWLVQSLLKLSKLDADAVVMKRERVEMNKLIEEALSPLLLLFELRDIALEREVIQEEIYVTCDLQWTAEALTNIIKNCMEHTMPGGKIHISYSDNNLYTKICITDTGVGIEPTDIPHIFERFYKGKNSKKDSVGIGLALSREIIVRQKGTIEVTSTVGIGTTFEIRLYR